MLAIGEGASGSSTDMLIHRLYPSVGTLHKKFGVQKALDSQNDAIGATDAYGHAASSVSKSPGGRRLTQKTQQPCWRIRPGTSGRQESKSPLKGRIPFQWKTW